MACWNGSFQHSAKTGRSSGVNFRRLILKNAFLDMIWQYVKTLMRTRSRPQKDSDPCLSTLLLLCTMRTRSRLPCQLIVLKQCCQQSEVYIHRYFVFSLGDAIASAFMQKTLIWGHFWKYFRGPFWVKKSGQLWPSKNFPRSLLCEFP
jgi:hypothetical protein